MISSCKRPTVGIFYFLFTKSGLTITQVFGINSKSFIHNQTITQNVNFSNMDEIFPILSGSNCHCCRSSQVAGDTSKQGIWPGPCFIFMLRHLGDHYYRLHVPNLPKQWLALVWIFRTKNTCSLYWTGLKVSSLS